MYSVLYFIYFNPYIFSSNLFLLLSNSALYLSDTTPNLTARLPRMSAKPEAEQDWFLKTRRKGPAPVGKSTFVLLRSLDVLLQYYLLRSNASGRFIQRIGGAAIPPATPLALGLSPYQLLIWTLSIGSAAKQIFWTVYISDNVFEAGFAAIISAYNTLLNTLNLLLSTWSATSNAPLSLLGGTVPVGVLLYGLGIYLETVSEIQRKAFKAAPGNKDRPFSEGLFGLATNMYLSSGSFLLCEQY